MNKLFLMLLAVGTVGCGKCQRDITHFTGELTYKCSRYGTEYVQSDSGLALSIDGSGLPVRCKP